MAIPPVNPPLSMQVRAHYCHLGGIGGINIEVLRVTRQCRYCTCNRHTSRIYGERSPFAPPRSPRGPGSVSISPVQRLVSTGGLPVFRSPPASPRYLFDPPPSTHLVGLSGVKSVGVPLGWSAVVTTAVVHLQPPCLVPDEHRRGRDLW